MNDLEKKFLLCTYVWWEKGANGLMALYGVSWGKDASIFQASSSPSPLP